MGTVSVLSRYSTFSETNFLHWLVNLVYFFYMITKYCVKTKLAYGLIWCLASLLLLNSCMDLVPLPSQSGEMDVICIGSDDRTFRALEAHTGQLIWETTTSDTISSLPTADRGSIYVGGTNRFYSFSAKTGSKQWEFVTGPRPSILSRPVVDQQTVYLLANNNATLYALNAQTGSKRWSATWPTFGQRGGGFSGPAVANGLVFVGGTDSTLYAFDAQSGARKWSFRASYTFQSKPLVTGGRVYAGCYNGKLYALEAATGKKVWEAEIGDYVQAPRLVDQTLYVTDWTSIHALDPETGHHRWTYQPRLERNYIGYTSLISISNETVYAGFVPLDWNSGFIYSLDATSGKQTADLWAWPGAPNMGAQVKDDVIYIAGGDKMLRAMNPTTRALNWSYTAKGNFTYSLGLVSKEGELIEP